MLRNFNSDTEAVSRLDKKEVLQLITALSLRTESGMEKISVLTFSQMLSKASFMRVWGNSWKHREPFVSHTRSSKFIL